MINLVQRFSDFLITSMSKGCVIAAKQTFGFKSKRSNFVSRFKTYTVYIAGSLKTGASSKNSNEGVTHMIAIFGFLSSYKH